MLSTLVQRQKHWTIPLMVSLALSWCLLMCSGFINPAHAMAAEPALAEATLTSKTPSCHGEPALTSGEATVLTAQHDNCSGCDTQATQLDSLSLPAIVLWVSWLHTADIWPVSHSVINVWFAQAPPPKPSVPLYLRKNLLLI